MQVFPYNGTHAVMNALRGGQIDASVAVLGLPKPHISAKSVRLLGVMGQRRPQDMPQVPTVRDLLGLSQLNVSSWNALEPLKTPIDSAR